MLAITLQIITFDNTKLSVTPSALSAMTDVNVYLQTAHYDLSAAEIAAVKVRNQYRNELDLRQLETGKERLISFKSLSKARYFSPQDRIWQDMLGQGGALREFLRSKKLHFSCQGVPARN